MLGRSLDGIGVTREGGSSGVPVGRPMGGAWLGGGPVDLTLGTSFPHSLRCNSCKNSVFDGTMLVQITNNMYNHEVSRLLWRGSKIRLQESGGGGDWPPDQGEGNEVKDQLLQDEIQTTPVPQVPWVHWTPPPHHAPRQRRDAGVSDSPRHAVQLRW